MNQHMWSACHLSGRSGRAVPAAVHVQSAELGSLWDSGVEARAVGVQGPAGQPNGSMTTGVRPTRQRKRKEVEVVDEATDRAQKRMVSSGLAEVKENLLP